MKILIKTRTNSEDLGIETMFIEDKKVLRICPLCENPEDAIIERDLTSCQDIVVFMKKAYEAGKNGEDFEVIVEPE